MYEFVVLNDEYGEVYFYLILYVDLSIVRYVLKNEDVCFYDDVMCIFMNEFFEMMDKEVRYVFVGYVFVIFLGEVEENISDVEWLFLIGGVEYVNSYYFDKFYYIVFGYLY